MGYQESREKRPKVEPRLAEVLTKRVIPPNGFLANPTLGIDVSHRVWALLSRRIKRAKAIS